MNIHRNCEIWGNVLCRKRYLDIIHALCDELRLRLIADMTKRFTRVLRLCVMGSSGAACKVLEFLIFLNGESVFSRRKTIITIFHIFR